MFIPILVSAVLAVCPVIAITLPNGFTFDENQYLNTASRATTAAEKCDNPYDGCSNDCSKMIMCDGNFNILPGSISSTCGTMFPYCVKNSGAYSMCSPNFPMSDSACLSRALVNFVCTEDGQFPDPTDCTKYHVCNGSNHNLVECLASHKFMSIPERMVDPLTNPGNGEYSCRFKREMDACYCDKFYCNGMENSFAFRQSDYHYYVYCFVYGSIRKTLMFKCPNGTSHTGLVSPMTNSVECHPPGTPTPHLYESF